MSDEKPFAEYGTTDEDGDGYPVRMIGAATYYCGSQNGAYLDAFNINSAVSARERKAAAKALRDYADEREAEARSFPLGATFSGGGLDDAPMFDVQMREVRSLRSRAAAIEGGAT